VTPGLPFALTPKLPLGSTPELPLGLGPCNSLCLGREPKARVATLSFIEEITVIQTIYFFTYRNPIILNYYSRSKYNKVDVFIIFI